MVEGFKICGTWDHEVPVDREEEESKEEDDSKDDSSFFIVRENVMISSICLGEENDTKEVPEMRGTMLMEEGFRFPWNLRYLE